MEEEIKVSIVIPVYNTSKYLKQCLDSVVNQTLQEIEIICVDDSSTDNSLEILKEYQQKDKRIKILNQKHKKQGAARNLGILSASGEYIGFVDSDDWCELDMFEKLYTRAKETDSDITMCAVTTFNDNNSNEFSKSNTFLNLEVFPLMFFEKPFTPNDTLDFIMDIPTFAWNKIIKKNLIVSNDIKFSEGIYFEEGAFFYDSWLSAEKISLIKDFGYFYRMYSDTSTCFSSDFNKLYNFKALEEKKRILKKHKIYNKIKKDFIAYKRKSILYWKDKIKDIRVKFLYNLLILFTMPSCFLSPLVLLKKELWLLARILLNHDKRIVFWGASLFLEKFILKYNIKYQNIIGIIDKNSAKQNKHIGYYKCYLPENLKELNVDMVIITILNFSKSNQLLVQEYLDKTNQTNIILKNI